METVSFASLGVSPFFSEKLEKRNIKTPTEIQRRVIPRLFSGESLVFRSSTGTGKTFAYLLPLLERLVDLLSDENGLRGKPLLVISAPTFELCSQIKGEADFLLSGAKVSVHTALLIGSASVGRQIETLKKESPEVIVGNPGRILALERSGKLKLRGVRFLVLDEGDRLVQAELFGETSALASLFRPPFQGVSCSATFPQKSRERLLPLLGLAGNASAEAVPALPADGKKRAGNINIEEDSAASVPGEKVEHWAFFSPAREKPELLRSLIAALDNAGTKSRKSGRLKSGKTGSGKTPSVKALIFTGRAGLAEGIASRLARRGIPAAYLSGGMDNTLRRDALDAFRSGKIRFLVSSDLAARGLDIDGVSHVIALDVNEDKDVYIHRAGRTARAGKTGVMVSIGTEGEMRRLAALEKTLRITVYPKVLYGGRILAPEAEEQ